VLLKHLSDVFYQMARARDSIGRCSARGELTVPRIACSFHRLDLDHLLHRPLARVLDSGIVDDADVRAGLAAIAARTAAMIATFPSLTWTYCHGDCHGFNACITAAGEAAFFDFDDGGPGYLAYDLAVFLWAKTSFGRKLHALWDAFIDGYRSMRPIQAADFEAAHAFVIVRHIWLMGEYASRAREWGSEPVKWIGRELDVLKGWEAERLADRLF
jgi:Ser/Thr protein kinase RdoA (MazF antagonist)